MDRKLVTRRASTLKQGDLFVSHGTNVTVLRDSEPCTDLFGRSQFRLWCSRADTGAEGWMVFGPEGSVLKPERSE